jgi:hypothetical protein
VGEGLILKIKDKVMSKSIRILETPIYLLVIAMACYEMGAGGTAIFLAIVSPARLYANIITYDSVYKKNN